MAHELRPYQRESVDALYDFWQDGGGNGLIVIPTGGGKSLILATICRELLAQWPTLRIGVITHVKELIAQNVQELIAEWRDAPVGIYSAGLGRRDQRARILFMGIQSVHSKGAILGDFDVIIVDEVHLIGRSADSMYGRFIRDCRERVPDMRLVGLTATPFRLDSGRLDRGPDALFEKIVYEAGVIELIEQGYLSPLIGKAGDDAAQIDTSGLHKRAGEFIQAEMDAAARIPTVVEMAVSEIVERGKDRAGWLAFCTGVDHARDVRDQMRRHGVSCEMVTGSTPAGERHSIIKRYKARDIRCLTSVGVLTTGFNAPHVDLLAMLRPTLSTGLYVQMIGRAFRRAPGKTNALILDFAGNVVRHGPVDMVKSMRSGGPGEKREPDLTDGDDDDEIKAKMCPTCRALVAVYEPTCPDCHYEWPPKPARHEPRAQHVAILSTEVIEPKWLGVTGVRYAIHAKPGSPDSMRVEYSTGFSTSRQWICFAHSGRARGNAGIWWRQLGGELPVPATAQEGVDRARKELRRVLAIKLKSTGPYPEIVGHHLAPEGTERAPQLVDDDIPF